MASRSLDDLAPPVKAAALRMVELCKGHTSGGQPLGVLIYCTMRSNAEQAALYAQGRTTPGPVLTNAGPGQSLHNPDKHGKAWAFDAVPTLGGKPMWSDNAALRLMGLAGKEAGLEWAGDWHGFKERVHFQIKPPKEE
jgi:peptidoglycan L-alanyl-D-glutamate endopeptidase CwlK